MGSSSAPCPASSPLSLPAALCSLSRREQKASGNEAGAKKGRKHMDLICTRCGEAWGLDSVLHDMKDEFERRGGLITHCPCCPAKEPKHSRKQAKRLQAVRELGPSFGDHIDGLAATLEDFDLVS